MANKTLRILPLSDIAKMGDGETVPSVQGTITKVLKPSSGTNDHGAWSLQYIHIKDPTGTCKVQLSNHDEMPASMVGVDVLISCWDSDKGLQGIKVKEDNYKDTKSNILKVTKSGTISRIGADASDDGDLGPVAAKPSRTEPTTTNVTPTKPAPTAETDSFEASQAVAKPSNGGRPTVDKFLFSRAQMYIRCLAAVDWIAMSRKTENLGELTDAQKQAATSTLFIAADRAGY